MAAATPGQWKALEATCRKRRLNVENVTEEVVTRFGGGDVDAITFDDLYFFIDELNRRSEQQPPSSTPQSRAAERNGYEERQYQEKNARYEEELHERNLQVYGPLWRETLWPLVAMARPHSGRALLDFAQREKRASEMPTQEERRDALMFLLLDCLRKEWLRGPVAQALSEHMNGGPIE
jgi:hypothetical protein